MLVLYLEHSAVNAVARDEEPAEAAAMREILELYQQGKLRAVKSVKSEEEMAKVAREETREGLAAIYAQLQHVPFVPRQELQGFNIQAPDPYTFLSSPRHEDHPFLKVVRPMGLADMDEYHLLLALGAGVRVFVTRDRRAFINDETGEGGRRRRIERETGILVRLPTEFMAEWRAGQFKEEQ